MYTLKNLLLYSYCRMSETDQLLGHLHSFNTNPINFTIPESIKQGVPLYILAANSSSPQLNAQFSSKWELLASYSSLPLGSNTNLHCHLCSTGTQLLLNLLPSGNPFSCWISASGSWNIWNFFVHALVYLDILWLTGRNGYTRTALGWSWNMTFHLRNTSIFPTPVGDTMWSHVVKPWLPWISSYGIGAPLFWWKTIPISSCLSEFLSVLFLVVFVAALLKSCRFRENDKPPTSFYVVRAASKPPCIVLRLGFIGGTPCKERHEVWLIIMHIHNVCIIIMTPTCGVGSTDPEPAEGASVPLEFPRAAGLASGGQIWQSSCV